MSAHFSENMITMLETEGCENPEEPKEILISALMALLENGTLDIEIFNQMIKSECVYRIWSKNREYEWMNQSINQISD